MNTKSPTEIAGMNRKLRAIIKDAMQKEFPDMVFNVESIDSTYNNSYRVTELQPKGLKITSTIVLFALPRDEKKTP